MDRILLFVTTLSLALLAVGCGSKNRGAAVTLESIDSIAEHKIVAIVDTISQTVTQPPITAVFMGADVKNRRSYKITVVFYPDKRATLSDDNNTYQLDQYITADGYGYKDKKVDLRGKGKQAVLRYSDGVVLQLSEVPKAD